MDNLNIPEHIRQNIKVSIDEALKEVKPNLQVDEVIKHMLTQISFEMYKTGWKDGHRAMKKAIELSSDMLKQ